MLKGIAPIVGPELLAALRAMGHGDEIAIVDANFPAASTAARLVRLDGVDVVSALAAVVSLLPLDDFGPEAAWRMQVVDEPDLILPIHREFADTLAVEGYTAPLGRLERTEFYGRAARAFVVVSTSEARLYGNVLLRKGVIRPDGQAGS
ncbi:hypothetical protein H7F51_14515 [Novosphingobium flavum]|uniref:D-ribose pyranase n=1 Tax=Novosphingobium flavum TaxID=1778672 RepID=A0A7X1KMK5_9SPHN|nr:hypothetical protein [Novosphingobium flavum]